MSVTIKQQFLGRFNLTSAEKDFNILNASGNWNIAVDTGLTFIKGYTGESATQLLEDMQVKIRAAHSSTNAANVTLDDTTGLVTLSFQSNPHEVTWTDAGLATILGFNTGALTGAASYTGVRQPRYLWRPTLPASEYPLTLQGAWMPRSTSRVYRSADGTCSGVGGNKIYEALVEFTALPEADVITPSTGTVYRDLQQFWEDVVSVPQSIRYQPDRTNWASNGVLSAMLGVDSDEGDEVGSFDDRATRTKKSYNGLWDVSLRLWKYEE